MDSPPIDRVTPQPLVKSIRVSRHENGWLVSDARDCSRGRVWVFNSVNDLADFMRTVTWESDR